MLIGKRYNELKSKFEEINLKDLVRTEANPRTRVRLQVLEAIERTNNLDKVTVTFNFHKKTVQKWMRDFVRDGIDGLRDKPRPGAATKLARSNEEKFITRLIDLQDSKNGGRVIASDIQKLL